MNVMHGNAAAEFAVTLRSRTPLVGSWVVCDNTVGAESMAGLGYDFLCVDGQHGLLDSSAWLSTVTAIEALDGCASMIRVLANDPAWIGRALDTGSRGVVVPLVNDAAAAAAAVRACRYPPQGDRSYGPMRSRLRTGLAPAQANDQVACVVMIETAGGVANVEEICAVAGLDGVLVGPFDLTLALGGDRFGDPAVADQMQAALTAVARAAEKAGIAAGVHCPDGVTAAKRFAAGFTFATVSSDLMLLEEAASAHISHSRRELV
jgi:4-hydroxy-2-oxoheptanedioate aldolase